MSDVAVRRALLGPFAISVEPAAIELDQRIADQHADPGKAEARPPAEPIGEQSGQNSCPQDRAEVDAHVEDREAGVAAPVAVLVERPDDGRDVGLEEAVADRDQRERMSMIARSAGCARRRARKRPWRRCCASWPLSSSETEPSSLPRIFSFWPCRRCSALRSGRSTAGRRNGRSRLRIAARRSSHRAWPARRRSEREITDRHDDRAELHRPFGAEILVGEEAADQRRQIDQRRIAADRGPSPAGPKRGNAWSDRASAAPACHNSRTAPTSRS